MPSLPQSASAQAQRKRFASLEGAGTAAEEYALAAGARVDSIHLESSYTSLVFSLIITTCRHTPSVEKSVPTTLFSSFLARFPNARL